MLHAKQRKSGWIPQPEDARGPYDVDNARVIHSASLRRLQGKTQILALGDSDFYRTRLTHSLEVAQVGVGIVRQLRKSFPKHPCHAVLAEAPLMQSICLTHDFGHPPFGHGGEIALNYCMRHDGGFEANGQTLRILSKLEKFSREDGADLTRRTLLGVLKYPVSYTKARNPKLRPRLVDGPSATVVLDREASKPPKCYLDSEAGVVDWVLSSFSETDRDRFQQLEVQHDKRHRKTIHKSLDCSIMDIADDIGYGVHDLEDAIAMGLIEKSHFRESIRDEHCAKYLDALKEKYPKECGNDVYRYFLRELFSGGGRRKHQISRMVHHLVTNVEPYEEDGFKDPLLKFRVRVRPAVKPFLEALKKLVSEKVIQNARVQQLEFKGQQMVIKVFEAVAAEPERLLPDDSLGKYKAESNPRVICDFVAGMTDDYLMKTFDRMYSPRMGSVFDRL